MSAGNAIKIRFKINLSNLKEITGYCLHNPRY